jgi:hypothetical protein
LRFASAAEFRTQVESVVTNEVILLSSTHRFFQKWLPDKWFKTMQLESKGWYLVCECGYAKSVWDYGGIRFDAAGNPMKLRWCAACHRSRWHRTEWHGPGGTQASPTGINPLWFVLGFNAAVWVGLTLIGLYSIFFVAVILYGMRSEVLFLLATLLFATMPLVTAIAVGRWFRAFAWIALALAIACVGFGVFFALSWWSESRGWPPGPLEGLLVPWIWVGAFFFPIAHLVLWRASSHRPKL